MKTLITIGLVIAFLLLPVGCLTDESFTSTLTDVEGNRYNVKKIGDQIWMVENLKTTKLNDGTSIPNVTGNAEWIALQTPGYCQYENNISYKDLHGNLYNWYAVETGKVCPSGWRVPTDFDFQYLIERLGGEALAGGQLKEEGTTHWMAPNTGANNKSGFSALPSGDRIGTDGSFYNLGGYAIFWTSDPVTYEQAINRVLVFDDTNMRIGYDNKFAGFSIRCVKN